MTPQASTENSHESPADVGQDGSDQPPPGVPDSPAEMPRPEARTDRTTLPATPGSLADQFNLEAKDRNPVEFFYPYP